MHSTMNVSPLMTVCNDHLHHLLHALRLHRLRTLHCSHAAGFGRHLHLNVVWFGKFILRMEFWFVFVCFFFCFAIALVVYAQFRPWSHITASTITNTFTFELIFYFFFHIFLENGILKMLCLYSVCHIFISKTNLMPFKRKQLPKLNTNTMDFGNNIAVLHNFDCLCKILCANWTQMVLGKKSG